MTQLTAKELRHGFESKPQEVAHILGHALRDFGYPVTDDYVAQEAKRLLTGEAARGGPSLFLSRWLQYGIRDID